jgi:hypothetical protein
MLVATQSSTRTKIALIWILIPVKKLKATGDHWQILVRSLQKKLYVISDNTLELEKIFNFLPFLLVFSILFLRISEILAMSLSQLNILCYVRH